MRINCEDTRSAEPECTRKYMRIRAPNRRDKLPLQLGLERGLIKLAKVILVFMTLLLTNCGLHLQGYADMPKWFNNVAVVNENARYDLRPLIIDYLRAYKINVCKNKKNANYLLVLIEDKMTDNVTAVSSSTTPRQYQMNYAIKYAVMKNNGATIIEPSSAVVTRQFTINSNRILGSDFEGDLLRKEMYKDAVAQIIDHIENTKHAR